MARKWINWKKWLDHLKGSGRITLALVGVIDGDCNWWIIIQGQQWFHKVRCHPLHSRDTMFICIKSERETFYQEHCYFLDFAVQDNVQRYY